MRMRRRHTLLPLCVASRRPPRPLAALLLTLAAILGGCATPPRGGVEPSAAFNDTGTITLARLAAASRPACETAPSGFRLLATGHGPLAMGHGPWAMGEFASGARVALARRAERSIDVRAHHIHRNVAGRALLRELRDAAPRSVRVRVRVRLLVDDYHVGAIEPLLFDLTAHAHVQVWLFNPLPLRSGPPIVRLLLSPGEFERHNHGVHNKRFVADNAMAVFGGRNIADEYFMGHAEADFIDLDVIAASAVVQDLSRVFDRYWNSDAAWPLHAVQGQPGTDEAAARQRLDAVVRHAAPAGATDRTDPVGQTSIEEQLQQGRLALLHASAQVFADAPEKPSRPSR